ncbi:hemolysin-type calcium-binding protein [Rhizorhabdus wittichii DC-6]|uniref:Calcium-binding protein n=1 Tax=Rhizorhabdus wittichii TaxID=160791 RepID=A0A975HIA4_9SPHN|nr:hemolysin-type calcium-binding protein [Rhizorhabdus wittichii DC-6]QTH24554.1 calcium-binding protein [Rhizorhabdus wittichii]
MNNFIFEEGTQAQAEAFTSSDTLYFKQAVPTDLAVVYTPAAGLQVATVTLTYGEQTLTFDASAFTGTNVEFIPGGSAELFLGSAAANTFDVTNAGSAAYGFNGVDTITVSASGSNIVSGGGGDDTVTITGAGTNTIAGDGGNDTLNATAATKAQIILGGDGADTITGGAGADHLYGHSAAGGADDGADSISGGLGNDYIQGNAGDDTLNGGEGSDRIRGGADDDTIHGDAGNDSINGNKGDDTIFGDAGNDSLNGGAGDDVISGGDGDDIISGDLGDDTIIGGVGADLLTGGDGEDVFVFAAGDADPVTISSKTYYDTITDFTAGTDKIQLDFALDEDDGVILQGSGATFTTFADANTYAQNLLAHDAVAGSVAAIQVGADTYLFYNGTDGTYAAAGDADQFILLKGVTAADLTVDDFTTAVA